MGRARSQKSELVGPWRSIHAAVWLIGLAILFWRGWLWPGILVLIAVSTIVESVIRLAVPSAIAPADQPETSSSPSPPAQSGRAPGVARRADLLPSDCPKCGAPVRGNEVTWTGPQSADCPYCGANLPMRSE